MSCRRHRYRRALNATHTVTAKCLWRSVSLHYSPGLKSKDNIESLLEKSSPLNFVKDKRLAIKNAKLNETTWIGKSEWAQKWNSTSFFFHQFRRPRCEQTAAATFNHIMAGAFQSNWFSSNKFIGKKDRNSIKLCCECARARVRFRSDYK